ncbi:MAG: phosphoribosylanthranilate isomerase [Desulfomonile tiedjei]|nr:phosphoribosylanthranilate isomerase [Desulfomonile tiedjei]
MAARSRTVRVKICGITSVRDAHAAVRAEVDALGFVFHRPSPRYVTPEQAAAIIKTLPPFIVTVGVFVNLDKEDVEEIAAKSGIHVIQLHGNEPPEDCVGAGRPVIKAFRFSCAGPFPDIARYQVSGLLMDSGSDGIWGGTGIPMDWKRLDEYLKGAPQGVRRRLVIAGGLSPDNVGRAIELLKPHAVDVSSGVESEPGIKNEEMIKEFIHAVRKAGFTQDVA